MHIHKPRLDHLLPPRLHQTHTLPELFARFVQVCEEDLAVGRFLVRPVIRVEPRIGCLDFEPSAGFEMLEGPGEEVVVVGDEAHEFAAVDVVEGAVVEPFVLEVVDLEGAVGWDPAHAS